MTSVHRRFPISVRNRLVSLWALLVLTTLMLGVWPTPVSAGLILQVQDVAAQSGGTGSFDVVIYATSGSFDVSGFQVELSVDSGSRRDLHGGKRQHHDRALPLHDAPVTPTVRSRSLAEQRSDRRRWGPDGARFRDRSSSPAVTFGIEHVRFDVAAGTPAGAVTVSILTDPDGLTQINDLTGDLLPFTARNGTITIGTSAVPEPSSLLMGIIAATGLVFIKRLRIPRVPSSSAWASRDRK